MGRSASDRRRDHGCRDFVDEVAKLFRMFYERRITSMERRIHALERKAAERARCVRGEGNR